MLHLPGQADPELVITCPFPARVNPHLPRLTEDTERWIREQGLFAQHDDADRLTSRFVGHRYAEVHARMWPDADYPGLWLANRLLIHMWCLDDFLDEIWGADQDHRADRVAELIGEVFAGRATEADVVGEPLAAALLTLWAEARNVAPDFWLDRAAAAYLAYLKASAEDRAQRWSARSVPTTAQYLASRNDGGGMFYATALIELANQAWLPDELAARSEIVDLSLRLNHAIAWANDLFAYQREADHGNGSNLMVVLTTHDKLSESEAAARVVALVNAELATLDFLCDAAEALPDPASRHAEGVRTTASGLLQWMATTARYEPTPSQRQG
ncbi:hypothetical protein FHX82_001925 [Amycolatopsis bartoniae]|uniref:terpene synthase family protein n=1 Tax=Amycolatopsis bartoniae TaxID=941986 RepID=UPI00118FB22A|nr:hypothetical protein [Amycolatopsis bartoniae]MBB2934905.1 hypothetical protein [Amycolatopsis bartoniae]TVS99510.1 hypothetical protein FNH07_34590 [Amycolatopsis bartoniae]